MQASPQDARAAAETAARASFGRLVAWLAWQWRDLAAAEDALADALLKALETWPVQGVPDSPEGWLMAVAKRQLLQAARHERVRADPAVLAVLEGLGDGGAGPPALPDARLRLMLVCAHPALDESLHAPLMLQAVLGIQVAEMAPALLVSPVALAQRLVRAKQKIRDARIGFEEPEARDLPARLQPVLEAIYAAYGLGAEAIDGAEARTAGWREEAIYLGTLVAQQLPDSAEALGLLALMNFCEARRPARFTAQGEFVPLPQQDLVLWDRDRIIAADALLWQAARLRQPGAFQLEAAVQSAHCQRLFTGSTPWPAIAALYREICTHFPTDGARVAGAVAQAEAGAIEAACAQLDAMETGAMAGYQPWWVARAHVATLAGDAPRAAAALRSAVALSIQPAVRRYLERLARERHGAP